MASPCDVASLQGGASDCWGASRWMTAYTMPRAASTTAEDQSGRTGMGSSHNKGWHASHNAVAKDWQLFDIVADRSMIRVHVCLSQVLGFEASDCQIRLHMPPTTVASTSTSLSMLANI